MRRLLRVLWRRLTWPLVGFALAGVGAYTIAGLLIAGVGVGSAPVLTAFEIGTGLVYLGVTVAGFCARLRDLAIDTDDRFDITFMRPLPRWLRTLVFAFCVAGAITTASGAAVMASAQDGQGPFDTMLFAGFAATAATYGFGRVLAERVLLREKADHFLSRQQMAELAKARAARAARQPSPPDPDAAVRRRIAERSGPG